jgi:phosphoglucosamine mutase
MPVYPQVKENVRVARRVVPPTVAAEVERVNERLAGEGRVLVRPSGTEPVVRVLAEAPAHETAAELCATVSELVRRELG